MERLIIRTQYGPQIKGFCMVEHDFDLTECRILGDVARRLAAYEDSGLSPEEVQALKRENEALKQEKQDLFREILRLSREKQYYVIRCDSDADETNKRTINDVFTYGPIYSDD